MEKFRKMYDLPPTDASDGQGTPSSHERRSKGEDEDIDNDGDDDDDDDDDVFGLKAAGASVVKTAKQQTSSPPGINALPHIDVLFIDPTLKRQKQPMSVVLQTKQSIPLLIPCQRLL